MDKLIRDFQKETSDKLNIVSKILGLKQSDTIAFLLDEFIEANKEEVKKMVNSIFKD